MTKLIFGCGYLGSRVAAGWTAEGDEVFAVTRSADRAADLERQGISPIVGDVTVPDGLSIPAKCRTVLFAVGFDRSSGKSIREVYVEGLRNVLRLLPDSLDRLVYISSTGVYGQSQGEWVNEDSVTEPSREGGRACLDAEGLIAADRLGGNSIVLRLAGIYGPGRLPKLDAVRTGEPLAVSAESWLNLIHVDDAVRAVLSAGQATNSAGRYVVSDGHPVRRREFYEEMARLLGAPPPRFATPASESQRGGDKRVRAERVRRDLLSDLAYPSYREGLAAILKG